jgi:hypothetical protein
MVNKIGAEVTNFQLIGRGLRQPNRQYKDSAELNELNVFTNSSSHDRAVLKLKEFLDESGLSDSVSGIIVTTENRVPHHINIEDNLKFDFISEVDPLILDAGVIKLDSLNEMQFGLESLLIHERDLIEPEELVQKIDFSKLQIFGLVQGKSQSQKNEKINPAVCTSRLSRILYNELSYLVPNSSVLRRLIKTQLDSFKNLQRTYDCRVDLVIKLKENIKNFQQIFSEKYYKERIAPYLKINSTFLNDVVPAKSIIYAIPDLGLETAFKNCVLGNLPKSLFNADELGFARYLDKIDNLKWMRCTPSMNLGFPYAGGNFYPDFAIFLADSKKHLSKKTILVCNTSVFS